MWQAREKNRKRARDEDKSCIQNLQQEVVALEREISCWRTWWQHQETHWWVGDKPETPEVGENFKCEAAEVELKLKKSVQKPANKADESS